MLATVLFATALLQPPAPASVGRRAVLGGAAAALFPAAALADVPKCPSGANNCYSTNGGGLGKVGLWTPPSGVDAAADLKAVLEAYPQAGQADVDKGGWAFAEGDLSKGAPATAGLTTCYSSAACTYASPLFARRLRAPRVQVGYRQLCQILQRRSALH